MVVHYTPIMPAFWRLKQKDHEFKSSLGHIMSSWFKKQNKTKPKNVFKNIKEKNLYKNVFWLPHFHHSSITIKNKIENNRLRSRVKGWSGGRGELF